MGVVCQVGGYLWFGGCRACSSVLAPFGQIVPATHLMRCRWSWITQRAKQSALFHLFLYVEKKKKADLVPLGDGFCWCCATSTLVSLGLYLLLRFDVRRSDPGLT